jgi:uncharacterized protein GlcG (DUF336 family)
MSSMPQNPPRSTSTIRRSSVAAGLARELIHEAESACASRGFRMSFAVVDDSGLLKAFHRMDGASFTSGAVAQDKAYTAASGRPTHLWHAALDDDEVLRRGAPGAIPRLVTLGGGYPIVGEDLLGGFGVSGGHYTQDMEIAVAALEAVEVRHEW